MRPTSGSAKTHSCIYITNLLPQNRLVDSADQTDRRPGHQASPLTRDRGVHPGNRVLAVQVEEVELPGIHQVCEPRLSNVEAERVEIRRGSAAAARVGRSTATLCDVQADVEEVCGGQRQENACQQP